MLFPTDCSETSAQLIPILLGMHDRGLKGAVGVTVVSARGMEQPVIAQKIKRAEKKLQAFLKPLKAAGLETKAHVLTGRAVREIIRIAKDEAADGMVVGSFGKKPLEEALAGSISEELTRESHLPVLFIRFGILSDKDDATRRAMGTDLCRRVLHPTDFSDCSNRALDMVKQASVCGKSEIHLQHVIDDSLEGESLLASLCERADQDMAKLSQELTDAGFETVVHIVKGDPVADMIRVAGEIDCSLIAMGSRGKGLVQETVLGSVSQEIMRMSNKPVLVVH